MPRARISAHGIDIAKPGFDVDTASLENMQFSSSLVAARIALTGVTTPGAFGGDMNAFYKQSIVTFSTAFPRPPIVLVSGIISGTSSDQTPFILTSAAGGMAYHIPFYEIRTFTDRFELCVAITSGAVRPPPATWRYWVFQNTLDA